MGPRCWSARAARFQKKESEDEHDWRYVHQFSVAWHIRETSFVFTFSGFFLRKRVCTFLNVVTCSTLVCLFFYIHQFLFLSLI